MNDLQKWIRIRKDLYRQMEAQVQVRLGGEDAELARYRKEYEKEFSKKWKSASREKLFERLNASRLVLMGDFHALSQSQKTHLRVLKTFETSKQRVLCLECFEAADQHFLDAFLAGKLSEKELLKKTAWFEKWGFPFEPVKSLLRWAQKNKVPVYGINRPTKKRTAATLKSRDRFAAEKLHQILKAYPEAIVLAIYGDLHLAKNHIPAEVLKLAGKTLHGKIFRLFQNSEKIYFQLLEKELESSVDVVQLGADAFCLLNVPPWVKWQNYLMYLEQTYDLGLEEEDDDYDESIDYTDHVGAYVRIISEDVGLPLSYDDLSVYTADDQSFWAKLQEQFTAKELTWIEELIEEETSFYLPSLGVGYLARPTVNHAATLAGKFVHAKLCQSPHSFFALPQDFLKQIWEEGMAYFLSKIINHKRKTDTVSDLRMALSAKGSTQAAKEPLMLALSQKMNELMAMTHRPMSRPMLRPKRRSSYRIAAQLLGGMLGERLYSGYRKNLVAPEVIRRFLTKSLSEDAFEVSYYEMVEIIESLPAPFRSKKERM